MTEQKHITDKIKFLKKLGIETDIEGRVGIDQTVMKKLKPIPMGNQYRTLVVADNKLMGFYTGVNEYKITVLTDTSLWLRYEHSDGASRWYTRFIPVP